MKTFALRFLALLVGALLAVAWVLAKDPPPNEQTMPGALKGKANSGWAAPYVHVGHVTVGKSRLTSVQWFFPDGKLRRDYSGTRVDGHAGYISDIVDGKTVIWGLSGEWKIVLPNKEGPNRSITAAPNGRSFFHQYDAAAGQIAVDVYVTGDLAGTVGPFWQYRGESVHPGADGSLGLLVWKDQDKKTTQVVAARPDGSVRMQVDCDDPVLSPVVAPGARGVLLQPNGDNRNTFFFYTEKGKTTSYKPGPNAGCVTWLPDSVTALMSSAIGHDYRFHLVDWSTGKELWDIRDPCLARVPGSAPRVAVTKNHLLFAGREFVMVGDRQEPVHCLYAVHIKTGKTVARWRPVPPQAAQGDQDEPWFFEQGHQLYLMTRREFSEINLDDLANKKRGWQQ
jgi:hypothetical protein